MDYPFWDTAVGYGPLMAAIAVVHVFIAHFAIGGGLYLVVTEQRARRRGDTGWLEYLKGLSRFFVLTTLVLGALTGVGIWFVIGLLSPTATGLLIHNFVWAWAIEWTFFAVEIAAALVYYYGWKRMAARDHLIVGWIYFGAAWLSLVVITGILSFMLTPGGWLESGSFWAGFLNPSYWPSVVLRTGICVLLAGIYALLVAARRAPSAERTRIVRYNAGWSLSGLALTLPSFAWFFASLPAATREAARERMPWAMQWFSAFGWLALLLAIAVVLFGLLFARRFHLAAAALLMALAFAWFGAFEFLRESIRKPWIVHGFLYGNGIEAAQVPDLRQTGLLPAMAYRTGDDGRDLLNHSCRSCHTVGGYNGLKASFDGTDAAFAAGMIRGVHVMRGNMPPFAGSPEEVELLAAEIAAFADPRPLAEVHGLAGEALGARSYAVRCGSCHVVGGYNDKIPSLAGLGVAELEEFLDGAGDLTEEMPPFTGDEAALAALAAFLHTATTRGDQG
ncbi:MAG: cytochrome ubiquinol oxidase subunit I [Thermoanaerobaculia bacterium]|nr:cytochrome ubiquinol oxidase subunit I [Thermoanaerobaculia bacterium]